VLAFLRAPRVAWVVLAAAPLPIGAALIFTARPVYPPDACFYGAPAASVAATDDYLGLMSPLAAFAMVAVALAALPIRGRWRLLAPATAIWAVVTLFAPDVAHPVMVYGGNVAVFGALLALVVLVLFAVLRQRRTTGIVMAILAIIPITDMIVVFSHGGPAVTALGVHGLTATVMLVDALLLLRERHVTTEKTLQPAHS
jgi:hypothetical protein